MNKYELVIICNASLTKAENADLIKQIEDVFKDNILEKDDLGIVKLAYKSTKETNAHIISYYLQASADELETKKKSIIYFKGISKFFVFKMTNKQKFFKMAELEKIYQEKFAPILETKKLTA